MKKIYLLFLPLLLCSCNGQGNTSSNVSKYDLGEDLTTLIKANCDEYVPGAYPFNATCKYVTDSKDSNFFVCTVTISYKSEKMTNLRIITIPSSFTMDQSGSTVANLGYDSDSFVLDNVSQGFVTNKNVYTFPGYRISYLTKDCTESVKVSLKSDTNNYLFTLSDQISE